MPLDFSLSGQAQHWLQQNNVEGVICELPTFDDVCAGQHWIRAVGHDGVGARIALETAWWTDYADTLFAMQPLIYLAKAIRHMRSQEIWAGENV